MTYLLSSKMMKAQSSMYRELSLYCVMFFSAYRSSHPHHARDDARA